MSVVEYIRDCGFHYCLSIVLLTDQRLIPIVFWIRFCIKVPTMLLRTIPPYCDSDNISNCVFYCVFRKALSAAQYISTLSLRATYTSQSSSSFFFLPSSTSLKYHRPQKILTLNKAFVHNIAQYLRRTYS